MTLPGGGGFTPPSPYAMVANQPGPLSGGLAEFAGLTEQQIKDWLESTWRPHFIDLGDPIEVLREITSAVIAAFKGDFDPLIDLFGSAIKPLPGGEILIDLLDALRGQYDGSDPILGAIQSVAAGFRSLSITSIPLGLLDRSTPNLLAGFGDFAAADTIVSDTWEWDSKVGHDKAGSARTVADGTRRVLTSEEISAAEGQRLEVGAHVRWAGAAGAADSIAVQLIPFDGDTAGSAVVVGTAGPGAADSGGWLQLADEWTVPAGVSGVRVRLVVEATMTAGTVWIDDVTLRKPAQSLPQQWISGLSDALGALGQDVAAALTWIKDLIERITGRAWSTLTNAFAGLTTWVGQLGTILSGVQVSNPLPSLVGAGIHTIRTMLDQIAGILGGAVVTPINSAVQAVKDAWATVEGWADEVVGGLRDAVTSVGGTVAAVPGAIAAEVESLIRNFAGAVLGGGSRATDLGLPGTFAAGSELAEIADGQREILAAALDSNAGYGNAVSSMDVTRPYSATPSTSGTASLWVPQRFDELLGPSKNCTLLQGDFFTGSGSPRAYHEQLSVWRFDAPGVWRVYGQITFLALSTNVTDIEVILAVHDVWERRTDGRIYAGDPSSLSFRFSASRYSARLSGAGGANNAQQRHTFDINKPVIIPEVSEPTHVAAAGIADTHDFVGLGVSVWSRVTTYNQNGFRTLGGSEFSSFNLDRLSTDTTDYNAPEQSVGSVEL